MNWYYVYQTSDGRLESEASGDTPPSLRPGLAFVMRATRFDPNTERWNAATHSFEAKPAPTLSATAQAMDTLISKPGAQWTQTDIANGVRLLLVDLRNRNVVT